MKGSPRCKNTKVVHRVSLSSEEETEKEEVSELEREVSKMNLNQDGQHDYEDESNWSKEETETEEPKTEITIKKVTTKKKNIVKVKVGKTDSEMYADSG